MAMTKKAGGGLATSLIGMFVRPAPDLDRLWYGGAARAAGGTGPFPDGVDSALIVAAWTERQSSGERVVKIAAVGSNGAVGEFYLKHVLLDPEAKR